LSRCLPGDRQADPGPRTVRTNRAERPSDWPREPCNQRSHGRTYRAAVCAHARRRLDQGTKKRLSTGGWVCWDGPSLGRWRSNGCWRTGPKVSRARRALKAERNEGSAGGERRQVALRWDGSTEAEAEAVLTRRPAVRALRASVCKLDSSSRAEAAC